LLELLQGLLLIVIEVTSYTAPGNDVIQVIDELAWIARIEPIVQFLESNGVIGFDDFLPESSFLNRGLMTRSVDVALRSGRSVNGAL
jgi:hypothetical protein